jgi:sulfite reductase alpha subunit-like flavoprotein
MADEFDDTLDNLHERAFIDGQSTVAQRRAAKQMIQRMRATGEAGKAAAEAIDLANQLAADGDPHKKKIAEALKNSLSGGVERMTTPEGEEGSPAALADPFSSNAPSKSLEASGSSSNGSTSNLPQPKKRGRPPKHRP